MPCEHVRKAKEFINRAQETLGWNSDVGSLESVLGGAFSFGLWTTLRLENNVNKAKVIMIEANNFLISAKNQLDSCKCDEENRIRKAKTQVELAENELKQLGEENMRQKLLIKKGKLDRLMNNSRLQGHKKETKKLRDAYEELIRMQEKKENENVRNTQDNIETIRDNLIDSGVEFDDLEMIRDLCEEVTKLQIQSEQEFVAQITIPLNQFN